MYVAAVYICTDLVPETFFINSIDPNSVTACLPEGRLDRLTATYSSG